MRSFSRNLKAISPIFATLILIAIAVIAGVVVYMFTSGTLAGLTNSNQAGQEKMAIQGVSGTRAGLEVYAQNMGPTSITVTSVMIKNSAGVVVGQDDPTLGTILGNELGKLEVAPPNLAINTPYTATVVTSAGGSFVSASFTLTA